MQQIRGMRFLCRRTRTLTLGRTSSLRLRAARCKPTAPPPHTHTPKGHGRTRQQRSSNRLMLSSAMVHGRPGRRRQALDASAAPAARRGAHMTGSAPSVAILKQFTCGSEAALAAASCSRLGDATMSCRRPATTAPRGARARPNAAARASISGGVRRAAAYFRGHDSF